MARKTKYSEDRATTILDGVRKGLTYRIAAASAGICEDTLTNWKKRYSDFSERLLVAEGEAAREAMDRIQTAGKDDWRAAAWIMEHRHPEDFGKQGTQHHTHAGDAAAPLVVTIVDHAPRTEPA